MRKLRPSGCILPGGGNKDMRYILFLAPLLGGLILNAQQSPALSRQALSQQTGPDGHWEGSFTANDRKIGVSLDLAKNAKAEWIASMGVPAQNATGLVVKDLAVNGKSVRFVAVELQMAPFDLILGPDGRMTGSISSPQGATLVEFKRTGEAKVELIQGSPAVSKELEGDWECVLGGPNAPNGGVRLVFHFKNKPDNTVEATIDSGLAASMVGMPLNDVKQTGQKVEFGIKIADASFEGTLNKESTELVGRLIHEGGSEPLTLRKK